MNKVKVNDTKEFIFDKNTVDGNHFLADMIKTEERFYHIVLEGISYTVEVVKINKKSKTCTLKINGNQYDVSVKNKFDELLEQMGFEGALRHVVKELRAPMPGLVLDIRVHIGDKINKGDAVIVLEAMKMENVLKATGDGIVKSLEAEKGKSVEKNQVLMVFE